ncbi:hypothetical protein KIN34_12880 [Cellulomonas sp. DKR-3]|uniref:PH domain-containing protein n=1 Tax=Cellulomonas fulva TaxID=2835530 RepID=A0ABS5U197_9CELL|nr:hypothetical protein [Cellulomonas fulva]MBT0995177.1 hypothetical protein [Cellulomonas fulva]
MLALLAVLLLAWWGMRRGWEARRRRTEAAVPTVPDVPADPGPALVGPVEAVYVSTTSAGDWLDRVVAHDLGVRSPATVSVHASGVVVRRTGARDLFVPAAALRGAEAAPAIAGKVVGRDGLVLLRWAPPAPHPSDEHAPEAALDTGLLPRHAADRDALVAAVAALTSPSSSQTAAPRGTQEKP